MTQWFFSDIETEKSPHGLLICRHLRPSKTVNYKTFSPEQFRGCFHVLIDYSTVLWYDYHCLILIFCYASAPEALCFRVVHPSVRPKPEIPSFDMYMGPLGHPTNRNRFTACPSVRPSVRPSGEVSGHLPENAWREWLEILHADVSWPSSELISLWPRSVDFSNFGAILT